MCGENNQSKKKRTKVQSSVLFLCECKICHLPCKKRSLMGRSKNESVTIVLSNKPKPCSFGAPDVYILIICAKRKECLRMCRTERYSHSIPFENNKQCGVTPAHHKGETKVFFLLFFFLAYSTGDTARAAAYTIFISLLLCPSPAVALLQTHIIVCCIIMNVS